LVQRRCQKEDHHQEATPAPLAQQYCLYWHASHWHVCTKTADMKRRVTSLSGGKNPLAAASSKLRA
jgi:hypothetical protein